MSKLKGAYGSIEEILKKSFDRERSTSKFFESVQKGNSFSLDSLSSESYQTGLEAASSILNIRSGLPQEQNFGIQESIRKAFGKEGIKESKIGGHPDFDYLADTDALKNGFNVSLFIDIKGSTKLGVTYSAETVFLIKNAIIRAAIETIQAFDGHVHRIMGDAVLAFFRSNKKARNAAIDAINCGTYIVQVMNEVVKPYFEDQGIEDDVGIRIGIDYGEKENVIWGMYGYSGASEVTATSFYVDIAAKLQQRAPKNRVLLGQSIKELLDLPEDILEIRHVQSKGERVKKEFVEPNYLDANGNRINYKQYVLNHEKYIALLPSPATDNILENIKITACLKDNKNAPTKFTYFPCAEVIKKSLGIDFKVNFKLPQQELNTEFFVKFRVKNTGNEAKEAAENSGNHETLVLAQTLDGCNFKAKQWEDTCYLGLHFMYISVLDKNKKVLLGEECFGIYIGDPLLEID
ncbi:adenylate/guanylate cyclase domain-containing protein [Pseudoalteromonas sp. K222D]|uniref:nucleotide-binding domain-containing protein n=1 Tax=Pseudoalteromonas sp. K222D TaxID=2820756 RepID=UPI001AD76B72|nr:adenylate/guanylate cyclase domain-containing protein [Pseudoalteromonas sp. K222D]MBO7928062.1 adenylate/guanylate cyclase domain-containing protein [Pseudoalteromonas sp. K222D]